MAKVKKAFFCKNCGFEAPKWLGRCPSCGEWNTFTEEIIARESGSVAANAAGMARHSNIMHAARMVVLILLFMLYSYRFL